VFGSNPLEEYVLVQERFEFSLEQMRELAANEVEGSFLSPSGN
jgi:aminodeoxyfutalosine deaminase